MPFKFPVEISDEYLDSAKREETSVVVLMVVDPRSTTASVVTGRMAPVGAVDFSEALLNGKRFVVNAESP